MLRNEQRLRVGGCAVPRCLPDPYNGRITLRFYEELNDHLTSERRKVPFAYRFCDGRTVAELLRELGVPCDAVELVLANGESVDFTYSVRDGDRISVYPVFESLTCRPCYGCVCTRCVIPAS